MYDLRSVGVRFGKTEVVRSIDLVLPSVGVVALVGANGAGKSTLLDALSGFVGHLGKVIERESGRQLNRAGLTRLAARLHQDVVLPSGISIGQFLSIASAPAKATCILSKPAPAGFSDCNSEVGKVYEQLREAVGEVELDRDLEALSIGQRRAVALSGVVLAPKEILLLDEPFVGLSESACDVMQLMLRKQARTRLVLVAAHDLELVLGMAARVVVLAGGRVALDAVTSGIVASDLLRYFG
jgi:branched-chain amino acid transport system ATP-binding protein